MRFPLIDRFGNHDDPDELLNLLDSLEALRTQETSLRVRIKASVYMEERVTLSVELDHVERELTTLGSPIGTSLSKEA